MLRKSVHVEDSGGNAQAAWCSRDASQVQSKVGGDEALDASQLGSLHEQVLHGDGVWVVAHC